MKALIVGGAGFVGSHVCDRLHRAGQTVVILDSFSPGHVPDETYLANLAFRKDLWAGSPVYHGSASDVGFLQYVFMEKPDVVVDMAALPIANACQHRRGEAFHKGIDSLRTLLEVCGSLGAMRPSRFVYISSSMVYGDFEKDPIGEDDRTEPHTIYGALKLAGEHITRAYCGQFDMEYVIIRPSAIYGPGDNNSRVVQKFLTCAIQGKPIVVYTGNDMRMDFTYVTDVAEGIRQAIEHPNGAGEVFNMTRGCARSLDDLVEIIKAHFPRVEVQHKADENTRPARGSLDIKKAWTYLGYTPRVHLERGVEKYVEYLRRVVR